MTMKNTKENNIQRSLWHINRHCNNIGSNTEYHDRKIELFYLKESMDNLIRIFNNEKTYPNLDRE
jgi:hypothetical protein